MAGIFQVKQLEAKKQALAAESEVYRQILKLEVENLHQLAVRSPLQIDPPQIEHHARQNMAFVNTRQDGRIRLAELHWYEAHGIGKKEFKRKRYLD